MTSFVAVVVVVVVVVVVNTNVPISLLRVVCVCSRLSKKVCQGQKTSDTQILTTFFSSYKSINYRLYHSLSNYNSKVDNSDKVKHFLKVGLCLDQRFSTDGSRPGNGSWRISNGSWA